MTHAPFALWTIAQDGSPAPAAGPVVPVGVRQGSDAAAPLNGTATTQPAGPGPGTPARSGMDPIFWLLPAMLLVMVLISVFGGRKEKKRRQELLANIKKGDRVQTLGGIIGTIVEMGDDDVVLRIEEGRLRIAKSAVQGIVQPSRAAGAVEAKPEAKAAV